MLNGKQALTAALVRPDFSDRTPYYGEQVYSNVKNMGKQPSMYACYSADTSGVGPSSVVEEGASSSDRR